MKVGEFLDEKRKNFSQFLLERAKSLEQVQAAQQIAQCSQTQFLNFIIAELVPGQNDIPALAKKILGSYQVEVNSFPPDDFDRVCRYLHLFIETIAAL